ncbi:MAG: hypothetical protein ACOYN4_04270 [Bacteroidales bacterium]
MKRLIIVFLFIAQCFMIKAQDLFKMGLDQFQKGEYAIADSILSLYLMQFPNDRNGIYNHAVTKLYRGDTCSFCNEMFFLRELHLDKEAGNLYSKFCIASDTVFYDGNYVRSTNRKSRFMEIIESPKDTNYKTAYIHDKRNRNNTTQMCYADLNRTKSSNIIAVYRLYEDSSKVFYFTQTPPSFPGGNDARSEYRKNNPDIQKAKAELNLSKFTANIEYIVDKTGNIRDVKLISTKYEIENTEVLMKYINSIISSMPKQIPAKFRDENVDYLSNDFISFW